jgi:hypothetical protein
MESFKYERASEGRRHCGVGDNSNNNAAAAQDII